MNDFNSSLHFKLTYCMRSHCNGQVTVRRIYLFIEYFRSINIVINKVDLKSYSRNDELLLNQLIPQLDLCRSLRLGGKYVIRILQNSATSRY